MATIYPIEKARLASGPVMPVTLSSDEEESVATLSLIARQFGNAAGADGTALILRGPDDNEDSILSLAGTCVDSGADELKRIDVGGGDSWAEGVSGRRWLLRRFPVSRDGRTFLLLGALFTSSRAGLRAVGEAERLFQPLIAGVARLWGSARAARRRLSGYAAALDNSDMSVILLDRDGDILFANDAASALMDAGEGLRRRRSTVTAAELSDAVKLQVAIDHVVSGDRGSSRTHRAPVVALSRGEGRRPLLVSVLAPRTSSSTPRDVAAILYLCDPDQDLQPLMQAACRYYKLSPVETRLASTLGSGMTLTEAADAMRIKEQTARSYLKQIFIKTGTRRQGELIRVLLTSITRSAPGTQLDII